MAGTSPFGFDGAVTNGVDWACFPERKPGGSGGRDSGAEGRPDARETWTKELQGGPKGSVPCSAAKPRSALRFGVRGDAARSYASAIVLEIPTLASVGAVRVTMRTRTESKNAERWDGH